ncbi:MAG: circularly permuted type 2 ATP-grasp protein [Pseudomonadota bacterium]
MLNLQNITGGQTQDQFTAQFQSSDVNWYDEAIGPDGKARAHWQGLLAWLRDAGPEGYLDAALDLGRLRTESGLAFVATGRPEAELEDALPVMLAADDWAELADGIVQRAELADAALADVYSERRAISAGLIPPGLIYGGSSFAAHCAGWQRPPRHWLHIYEADVARMSDGSWVLLADRLDAPLGDGWLLANRIAATQAFADPFVDLGVRRLASHYAAFQDHLDQMMGWDGRLALLTGGEKDPRFFSHAYFARYMNAALVEPADLTVRDGAAFVKTLDGLKRVDVMLRGVPDSAVDALHQPKRAAFGAPALSLAAQSGSLKLANAIGSAAFAYRALAPFAHRLSQHLLGQALKLPDAPCLWLGSARARDQVIEERDDWRIEPLTSDQGTPANLEEFEKTDDMRAVLDRAGEQFCAVRTPRLARTPVWSGEGIRRTEWMMRVFACRTLDGWSVAPGGVASAIEPGRAPRALGFGKDVWVLPDAADKGEQQVSGLLKQQFSIGHLRRTGRDLLSRVADELFWLGRNSERAESVLRVLSVCLDRHLGGNRADSDPEVLATLIETHASPDEDLEGLDRYRDAVHRLARDHEEGASIPAILSFLQSGAMRARASISAESWRYIDRLCSDRRWQSTGPVRQNAGLARLIEDSIQSLAAFAGSAQDNLTRNYAWRFLELGRRLERGAQIANLGHRVAGTVHENEETYLRAWLTLGDSASAYRSRYMMTAQAAAVIDLMVLDETNPRALGFQLAALERVLSEMPTDIPYRRGEHRRALALLTDLRMQDASTLAEAEGSERPHLRTLMKGCEDGLAEVSDLIGRAFFAHTDAPEALVSHARQENRP